MFGWDSILAIDMYVGTTFERFRTLGQAFSSPSLKVTLVVVRRV